MRAVVQRVTRAEVTSRVGGRSGEGGRPGEPAGWESVGAIGAGLCVLVGATHDDDDVAAVKLARKIWGLRILDDGAGVMNRSLSDVHADGVPAEALVVSQFTLYGDTAKGRRPSWIAAARPEQAEPLVERVVDELRAFGATVATGRFRTEMRVDLVNDGPVTLVLEV